MSAQGIFLHLDLKGCFQNLIKVYNLESIGFSNKGETNRSSRTKEEECGSTTKYQVGKMPTPEAGRRKI